MKRIHDITYLLMSTEQTHTVCDDTTHKLAMRTTGFWGLLSKMHMLEILLSRSGSVDFIIAMNCNKYIFLIPRMKSNMWVIIEDTR